ncbi:hypothetical protein VTL71DRAFT_5384 [Oculimacula yallundae]|uniref:DUF7918 domain-containing protein n=1 Tax=Oculimacula yallundae TaxID=86028 RepID=A0ABR4C0W7_9HELO
MAVLNLVPGLEVYVKIDGISLQEYDDDDEIQVGISPVDQYKSSRTVTKYIESVTDKEFTVETSLAPGFVITSDALLTPIRIDGKLMITPLIPHKTYIRHVTRDKVHTRIVRVVDGIHTAAPGQTDQCLLQKFRFARIQTCMEDEKLKDIKKDTQRMNEVGEIVVTVHRSGPAKMDTAMPVAVAAANAAIQTTNAKVHEKALKGQAKSHSVSSRDALKSLLIIERTPSPPPQQISASPPPVDVNNLDPEQKKQVARFLQGLNGNRGGSGSPGPSIKRERDTDGSELTLRNKRNSGKSVMIDLTKDSEDSDDDVIEPLN